MPLVKRYTFQVNQKALSSQVNANFDDIITAYNAHSHTNIGTDVSLITSSGIAPGAIGATALSTGAITLGYAQITSNFTANSNSAYVDVTGLTTTITPPNGGRRIEITAWCANINPSAGSPAQISWSIVEGSTVLAETIIQALSNNQNGVPPAIASFVPTAASHTYKVQFKVNQNANSTVGVGTTSPAFILVKAI